MGRSSVGVNKAWCTYQVEPVTNNGGTVLLCQMAERSLPFKGGTDTDIRGSHRVFISSKKNTWFMAVRKWVSEFATILFSCYTEIQKNEELPLEISTWNFLSFWSLRLLFTMLSRLKKYIGKKRRKKEGGKGKGLKKWVQAKGGENQEKWNKKGRVLVIWRQGGKRKRELMYLTACSCIAA